MLNLKFISLLIFLPPLLILINTFWLIVNNYILFVSGFLSKYNSKKLKNKQNKKDIVHINIINPLAYVISIFFFFLKFGAFTTLLQLAAVSTVKYAISLLFLTTIMLHLVNILLKWYYSNTIIIDYTQYIGAIFIVILFFTLFSSNFLILFFFLELFGYLFYFQFLQVFDKSKTKKKVNFYLDSLLLYYWVNFFGSILILYSIIYLFKTFNTVDFTQLIFFNNYKSLNLFFFFFFVGLGVKMGVAGLHFLKIEIYKNLRVDSVINFSFYSTFGYLILIKFVLTSLGFANHLFFIYLFIFFVSLLIPFVLKITNIVLFFGFSTLLNVTMCLFLFF